MDLRNLNASSPGNDSDAGITDDSPYRMDGLLWYLTFSDIMNITGNIIIVILIYKECKMTSTPSKLLVNQAVADGMTGLTFFIVSSVPVLSKDGESVVITTERVILTIYQSESLLTLGATMFCLYGAICHPITYRIHNKTWIVAVFIVVSWIINVGVACLFFAADDSFFNDDYTLSNLYRHDPQDIWYEVLKLVVMFLAPLLGVVCFVKVIIYKRSLRRGDVQSQSSTNQLVRQSLGVMLMSAVYVFTAVGMLCGENIILITKDVYTNSNLVILQSVVYHHLVLKLPLFLLLFKPYRKRARRMFCPCLSRNEISPQESGIASSSNTRSTKIAKHLLPPRLTPALASTSRDSTRSDTSMPERDLSINKHSRIMQCNSGTNLPDVQ